MIVHQGDTGALIERALAMVKSDGMRFAPALVKLLTMCLEAGKPASGFCRDNGFFLGNNTGESMN